MTDEFNTPSLEDSQSLQVFRALDVSEDEYRTSSELYEEGASQLRRRGIDPQLDQGGNYAYHRLYMKVRPPRILGVTYQENFRVCLELHTPNHQLLLEDVIRNMEPEVRKFWLPMIEPDPNRRKPIYLHAIRMLIALGTHRQINSSEPFELSISLREHSGCKAWIPKLESFAPQMHGVKFEDICTILPPAENELLMLILGRALVGRDNSRLAEGEIIRHTARMAGIIVGKDAGLGKSSLFNSLIASLRKAGYIVETFGNIASRFNLAPIALSHLTYKDDMTLDTLKAALKSENTKIMVTGGSLRTEDKGVNAVNTPCHTVILANTNNYDPRIMYDLDTGIVDRIKLLETYRESYLAKVPRSELIRDTPTLKPYQHLPWLANKLEVSLDALMLYMGRLAVDKFYSICSHGIEGGGILEKEVRTLTSKCKIQFRLDATETLMATAFYCHLIRFGRFDYGMTPLFPALDSIPLASWMGSLELIMASQELRPVREIIQGQFLEFGKPKNHPQVGFNILSSRSLLWAFTSSQKMRDMNGYTSEMQGSLQDALKATLGQVRLIDGFSVSSDPVWVYQAWDNVKIHAPHIYTWVKDFKAKLEAACAENMENYRAVVDILHSTNYRCSSTRYTPGQEININSDVDINEGWQ